MKICCLIASLRMGGAERQLAGLAAMLRSAGEDAEVLTYRVGGFYEKELADAGVPHISIPSDGGDRAIVRRIAAHLKDSGCDVLVSFLAGTNIKACMVKRLCPNVKLIVSERNVNLRLLPHDIYRFLLYRRADAIVCNSYAQAEFMRRHAPALCGKLSSIPNFVDTVRFSPAGEREYNAPLRVVTTARLDSRKNALGLIRAAAAAGCDNLRFDWYGAEAEDRYARRCKALIAQLGLEDRFGIHPSVSDAERIYAEADAFCLPSFYEGTPNSLAEALASGLPALCSRVSDNSMYVQEGTNGFLFNPNSVESMAEALRALAALTPAQLDAFGRESRRRAEEKLSKKVFIERYMALLKGLPME